MINGPVYFLLVVFAVVVYIVNVVILILLLSPYRFHYKGITVNVAVVIIVFHLKIMDDLKHHIKREYFCLH